MQLNISQLDNVLTLHEMVLQHHIAHFFVQSDSFDIHCTFISFPDDETVQMCSFLSHTDNSVLDQ